MSNEEKIRKRDEELSKTPLRKAHPEEWPTGVRPIAIDEMDGLGVDADGTLYWHGKSIAIKRVELRSWEFTLAAIAALGTILSGLAAMFPSLPEYLKGFF